MIGNPRRTILWMLLAAGAGLTVAGCGSNGDAGIVLPEGGPTLAAAVQGTVLAPNGQFAAAGRWRFWMHGLSLVPPAYALLQDELLPVESGVNVSLSQIDPIEAAHGGTDHAKPLGEAETDAQGRFEILDPSLTILDDDSHLMLQVGGAVGATRTRAFVLRHDSNDIGPVSETVVRVVLDRLTQAPAVHLSDFTLKDLTDITDAVRLATATASGVSIFEINQSAYQLASDSRRVQIAIDDATGVPVAP